jgi:hypothetical protein
MLAKLQFEIAEKKMVVRVTYPVLEMWNPFILSFLCNLMHFSEIWCCSFALKYFILFKIGQLD